MGQTSNSGHLAFTGSPNTGQSLASAERQGSRWRTCSAMREACPLSLPSLIYRTGDYHEASKESKTHCSNKQLPREPAEQLCGASPRERAATLAWRLQERIPRNHKRSYLLLYKFDIFNLACPWCNVENWKGAVIQELFRRVDPKGRSIGQFLRPVFDNGHEQCCTGSS